MAAAALRKFFRSERHRVSTGNNNNEACSKKNKESGEGGSRTRFLSLCTGGGASKASAGQYRPRSFLDRPSVLASYNLIFPDTEQHNKRIPHTLVSATAFRSSVSRSSATVDDVQRGRPWQSDGVLHKASKGLRSGATVLRQALFFYSHFDTKGKEEKKRNKR